MEPMIQETSVQKKRNMKVLALLVISIILAASLVGVVAVYLNDQAQLSDKDSKIASLQLQLSQISNSTTAYLEQVAYLNQQIDGLNQQIDILSANYNSSIAEYSSLLRIVQMQSSGIMFDGPIVQDANTTTILYGDAVDYGGFVVVQATANSTSTYAQVMYTFGDFNFDYNQTLGISGTAAFPMLPGIVQLVIGNMNEIDSNAVNATATYYF